MKTNVRSVPITGPSTSLECPQKKKPMTHGIAVTHIKIGLSKNERGSLIDSARISGHQD